MQANEEIKAIVASNTKKQNKNSKERSNNENPNLFPVLWKETKESY